MLLRATGEPGGQQEERRVGQLSATYRYSEQSRHNSHTQHVLRLGSVACMLHGLLLAPCTNQTPTCKWCTSGRMQGDVHQLH